MLNSGKTPLIIDAGANIGAASVWFATAFPQAIVIAVEPDAANAAAYSANTYLHKNIRLIQSAIGGSPGYEALSNPDQKDWAVQSNRTLEFNVSTSVNKCTISDLLAVEPAVDLFIVKIDIEGFELDLFSNSTEWVELAKVIFIEPHDWMITTQSSSHSFQRVLGGAGFDILISGENLAYVRC